LIDFNVECAPIVTMKPMQFIIKVLSVMWNCQLWSLSMYSKVVFHCTVKCDRSFLKPEACIGWFSRQEWVDWV